MDNEDQLQGGRRPRVLICDAIADEGVALLRAHADVDIRTGLSSEELLQAIAEYEAIVVRSATRVTADVIARGQNLRVIARAGAGLDNVDVAAAQAQDIAVVNSPDANTLAVAEHTMGLLLSLARRLPRADLSLKEGKWEKKQLLGMGLAGKTLGIIGFGRIGREVAVRALAFGMKILVNQRRQTPELDLTPGVKPVDLLDLLGEADFVTLHVPKTAATLGMIGAGQLALMKNTAYIINTARGGVIDEGALLAALDAHQIAGAALDVFVEEPAIHSSLAKHERVIATPHIAASTQDAQRAAALTVAEQIIPLLQDVEVEAMLPLRVVSLDQIVPYESVDEQRVQNLVMRLRADGILQNPPVVMETEAGYLVLDGATRVAALRQLRCRDIVVQVHEDPESLELGVWHHVVQDLKPDRLIALIDGLADIALQAVDADHAAEVMFEYGGLCTLRTVDGRAFVAYAAPGVNRLQALMRLATAYLDEAEVARTVEDDLVRLQNQYPEMTAKVVYPPFTVRQVLQASQNGAHTFPAGVTRFLVPGRVLRMNVPLAMLEERAPLPEKNRQLHESLGQKKDAGSIRFYGESVYVLDD